MLRDWLTSRVFDRRAAYVGNAVNGPGPMSLVGWSDRGAATRICPACGAAPGRDSPGGGRNAVRELCEMGAGGQGPELPEPTATRPRSGSGRPHPQAVAIATCAVGDASPSYVIARSASTHTSDLDPGSQAASTWRRRRDARR
ncbi:hypothetical protein [Nonomuraea dietziae]|uniref:hypothetical protein n=1 Tax=Nonomuraea dietziae TaxID=65515 RepID=UPI0031E40B88